MRRRPLIALLAACGSAACDIATDPDAVPTAIVSVSVDTTAGPLVRTISVVLDAPGRVRVRYETDGAPTLEVAGDDVAETHELVIARLVAGATYRFEVHALTPSGETVAVLEDSFPTGALPADLAGIAFEATGSLDVGLALLHLYDPDGFKGYVAVDGDGSVVWFHRTVDLPFGIDRRANGNFVLMDKGAGLVELTPAGRVVRTLPQHGIAGNLHHDAITTPENTVLFLAQEPEVVDGRTIVGEAVWEWTPETGTVRKRWSSHATLDPAVDRGDLSTDDDWLHANSLHVGPRGNILVSLRRLDQVISLAPGDARIEWRLGGVGATLHVADDERFTGQHTAAEIAPGRILLFDNRHVLGGYSRAAEFVLDGDSARTAWEWRPETDNFAFAVSSARRLADGHTLVGFGMSPGLNGSTGPIEVFDVAPSGAAVWHLVVRGPFVMYRAEPLEDIAGERIVGA